MSSNERPDGSRFGAGLGIIGTLAIAAMAGLVPLAFLPPSWALLAVDSTRPLILVKEWMLRGSAGLALLCAAALLLAGRTRPWRDARLPAVLVGVYLATTLLACAASKDALFAFRAATSEITVWLVVLTAPLLLTTPRRVRWVLWGAAAGGLGVGAVAAASAWGKWGGALKFIYGRDYVAEVLAGDEQLIYSMQGGLRRIASQATLGNPEYTGTYLAAILLLVAMWLLSGWGSRAHRFWPGWVLGVVVAGVVAAAMVATGTRGAWVVVAAGAVACWLGALPLAGAWIAGGLAITLETALLLGALPGAVVGGAMLLAVATWQIARGHAAPAWRALLPRVRVALVAAPVAVIVLLAAQTFPNPLNRDLIGRANDKLATFSTADDSVRERAMWLLMASDMALAHPVAGVGPGFYPVNLHPTLSKLVAADDTGTMAVMQRALKTFLAMDVHNDWFQVAAEQGLLGLLAFLGVWTSLLAGLARAARSDAAAGTKGDALAHALLVVLVGFATMMLTSFPLQEPSRLGALGGVLAAAMATLALERKTSPATT